METADPSVGGGWVREGAAGVKTPAAFSAPACLLSLEFLPE